MISAVISDVDGTAVKPHENFVCKAYLETFEKIIKNGYLLCFASGRSLFELELLFEKLSGNVVFIANDGACCAFKGGIEIFKKAVDYGKIICLFNLFSSFDCVGIEFCSKYFSYVYGGEKFCSGMRKERKNNIKIISSAAEIEKEIYKITLFNLNEFSKRRVKNAFCDDFDIIYEGKDSVELVCKNVNKQLAAEALINRFGIKNSQILAVGNGDNDILMLKSAGVSLAVENAGIHIKNICSKTINSICEIEKILKI